jgi:2-oxo-4-hydroxy-4-carboxy-5-ureidoimidazoline decarboxylase
VTVVLSIDEVNALDEPAFVDRFGAVYESTPALAAAAWTGRPFADRAALIAAFAAAAGALDEDGVLDLLLAHPQLAVAQPLTEHSRAEQRSAGLTDLDLEARDRIRGGNAAYRARFGFPFILAVRGLGADDVARALDERLGHDRTTELATARAQVDRIAALRIELLVQP